MSKKIISLVLAAGIVFSSISVFAARTAPLTAEYVRGYLPGETEHLVDVNDCIDVNNAEIMADGVQIAPNGSATFGFFLPYAVRSMKIAYAGVGEITVKTETNQYNPITLDGSGEALLEFGKNLGYDKDPQWRTWPEATNSALQDYVEHPGEKLITITASSTIKIKKLLLEKEMTMGPNESVLPNVSDYTMETTSTVLMHQNASIIVVNGGRRYIDNNNTAMRPVFYEGSLYLPINTLAKALGYYHEDIPEEGYALMRSGSHEVVLLNGSCTVTKGLAKPVPAPENVIIHQDGQTFAAVRYFGELTGETVGYKDGLIAIDDKYTVAEILNDAAFYSYADEKFAPFKEATKVGNTYYVSQTETASDKNTGGILDPFKTINKAAQIAQPGDTVIVREGVYRETITPKNNGTATAPITYKAAEGDRVVISAAEELGTPHLYNADKGEYVIGMPIDLGDGKNQIFINGEMMTEARYPDEGEKHVGDGRLSDAFGVRGQIWKTDTDYDTFYSDTLLNQEDDYWVGGTYVGTFGMGYGVITGKITDSTKGSFKVSDRYRQQRWWWNVWVDNLKKGTKNSLDFGMIVGHINAMNLPKEWVRTDDGILHIILPDGTDPKTVKIEAKARQLVADLTDKKFINLEGFETIGGSVTMGKSEMCMLNGLNMKYLNHYTLNADARNGYIDITDTPDKNGYYYDNTKPGAPQRGEVGIYLGGTDDIIVNTVMDHAAGAAIYMTGLYSYIENNIIKECGYMGSYTSAIHADTIPWEPRTTPRGGYSFYNNTIYNIMQSGLDFCRNEYRAATSLQTHQEAPWLPNEIAYNDFHDCNLASVDAGAVYCNGSNVGFDKQMTNVHHNYVYKTLDVTDGNPFDMGLYWDGGAHGFDTFNNLIFNTGSEGIRHQLYQQAFNTFEAYERLWNNHTLGGVDVDSSIPVADALEDGFFPDNRPFFAGTTLDRDDEYKNNINRFKNGSYGIDYPAIDAEVSNGVVVDAEDGYADFSGDGQYIIFRDVDFGSGSNEMLISYRCDSNWTYDKIEIAIGSEDGSVAKVSAETPMQDPPSLEDSCSMRVNFIKVSGVHDVWLKINKYYSASIGGISVFEHSVDTGNTGDEWAHYAYAVQYTDYNKDNEGAPSDFMIPDTGLPTEVGGVYGVRSTWTGYTLRYAKQEITDKASGFVMSAGSRDHYRGQLINIYICEPTDEYVGPSGEPVAQFRTVNKHFYDQTPAMVPLLKDVEPGIYDIYVEFSDEEGLGKTSNITYFGFVKEGVKSLLLEANSKTRASAYDASISVQNEGRPFGKVVQGRLQTNLYKITNTLPGTTAGYSNIDLERDYSKVVLEYNVPDAELADMPITVRIANENGIKVASGTTVTEACDGTELKYMTVELDNIVPAGNYTVYIDFGGDKNSNKTCHLTWFGFTE